MNERGDIMKNSLTRWKRHDLLGGRVRKRLLWLISVWLCFDGMTGSAWAQFENEYPVACFTSVTPPSPKVDESVTISGSCSYDPDGVVFQYKWTFSDGLAAYTGSAASVTRTFSQAGTYAVFLQVKDNDGAWSSKIKRNIPVTASNFTVNIVPTAGCTVTAGDGGVDVAEAPNGILCSGGMAATNPLCTEQFKNADLAVLKVALEPGYGFTGWIVDGAHIQMTSVEPLFLTTRPLLASTIPAVTCPQETTEQASCQRIDLAADSNNDDSIDLLDDPIEETSGKMIDYQNPAARIPVQLSADGVGVLDDTYSLELAAGSGGSHLLVWESATATTPLTLPKTYALDALPSTLYVSGCQTSDCGPGDVTLALRLVQRQKNVTKTVLEDLILLSVLDVAQIAGQFRIIGYENQAQYEMKLTEEPDGSDSFFRTLGGMRLHLQAVTLPGVEVEEYAWSVTDSGGIPGEFYVGYSHVANVLIGNDLKGATLSDVYWQSPARINVNAIIALTLKIKNNPTPIVLTRSIRSRELSATMKGDDIGMLQAKLRSLGIAQGSKSNCSRCYGWRGIPVEIDRSFGPSTTVAIVQFRDQDELQNTGIVDTETLEYLQRHWNDYLAAFEAYPTFPTIDMTHSDFETWLDVGASELGTTFTDEFVAQVSNTVTRKDILRAWIVKEATAGHRGFQENWSAYRKIPYRIVLGGSDSFGSIGFSQIKNRYKYGKNSGTDGLRMTNLYHPQDAVKGFAIWSNTKGLGDGFYYAFKRNEQFCSEEYQTFVCSQTYQQITYPRLNVDTYTDQAEDRLSKGLGAYKEGIANTRVFREKIWPELLRQYSPDDTGSVQTAIRYALEVKQGAGLELSNRKYTWMINATESFEYTETDWLSGLSWEEKKNRNYLRTQIFNILPCHRY